jgi:catechol 2,3-dioxygenase-like lactoylglutathione lyase family enzyme
MINGAHVIIYSRDAAADRAFFKDVLQFKYVDAHDGWLIFKLPPAETAVHPSDENDLHELYLMTDDLDLEIRALKKTGVSCAPVSQQAWGRVTRVQLPGGGILGLYQPRHARP